MLAFTPSEKSVDPLLGYPPAFAKLCRHGRPLFADSPPQCFLPYSLSAQDAAKARELESLFPCEVAEDDQEQDSSIIGAHVDFLWTRLDHLGNAGFDPSKFRVDPFGNVLNRNAVPPSPLAWAVDHWFPPSRGGKARVDNLRLVQWQVLQSKGEKLEFLMPWWDLQLGISVNQFLSIFACKNSDFRQRAFALLFPQSASSGYSELESHYWPQHFKQKAREIGFAAAAVEKVRKHNDDHLSGMDMDMPKISGALNCQQWHADDDALLIALQKYRPVNWAERMCLLEREKDEFRRQIISTNSEVLLVNGCEKEFTMRHSSVLSSLQQEKDAGLDLSHKMQQTKEQVTQLERELKVIKQHNEREKVALEELEDILEKHKKRVDKQRRWSESQSHYRQCLERIIRDTLHQSSVFREKVRLNKAACTALLAKIQSQRMSCDDAEQDLAKQCREREALEILAQPSLMEYICRCLVEQGFLNCGGKDASDEGLEVSNAYREEQTADLGYKKCTLEDVTQRSTWNYCHKGDTLFKPSVKCMDTIPEEDEQREVEAPLAQMQRSPLKRKVTSGELDAHTNSFQRHKVERICATSQAPNAARDGLNHGERMLNQWGDDKQLDDLLQEVLTLRDKPNEGVADCNLEENEEQRVARLGKSNVDKWLQKLLLDSPSKQSSPILEDVEEAHAKDGPDICRGQPLVAVRRKHDEVATVSMVVTGVRAKKGLGRLFRRMGFRHDAKKLRLLKERANQALDDVQDEEISEQQDTGPCCAGSNKVNLQAEHLWSSDGNRVKVDDISEQHQNIGTEWLERSVAPAVRESGQNMSSSEGDDDASSELDFVRRMRELREEETVRQNRRMSCPANSKRLPDEVVSRVGSCNMLQPDKLQKVKEATTLPVLDRMSRSYSMRATSSGGRWVLHTRKGSDVFPSTTMEGDSLGEEVEIVLQPSSSFRREHEISESHAIGASSNATSGSYGSMGLRASLKTCTKVWKRAISKRATLKQ